MNDLSPPSPDPAQADVLATIRRLLAQDAAVPDGTARNGALRRRLIGTRRHGGAALMRRPTEDALPLGEADIAGSAAALPLRLVDDQRVTMALADKAGPMADEDTSPTTAAPVETALSLTAAPAPDVLSESAAPVAEDAEPLSFSMSSPPKVANSGLASPVAEAPPFLHDVPASGDASGAWSFTAAQPESRLRDLLTFQAWIAEADHDAEATTPVPAPAQAAIGPEPPLAAEADTLAPPPVLPEAPVRDSASLQVLVRETLLQELAGETGTQLADAVRQLARKAIATALDDMARDIAGSEAQPSLDGR